MNIERMKKLADAVEHGLSAYIEFGMRHFCTNFDLVPLAQDMCRTAACIGGHAVLMFGKPGDLIVEYTARQLLGLSAEESQYLFYNGWPSKRWTRSPFLEITRQEAAMAIRRMVECGGIPLEHRL